MTRAGIFAFVVAGFVWTGMAFAEVTPRPGTGDPHIQTVMYDPQEVVGLHVVSGFALTVMFAADERIQTVTVGDGAAWQVQTNRAADNLVIKPQGSSAATNLTVVTDVRIYRFALYSTYPGDGTPPPYTVTFTYPPLLPDHQQATTAMAGFYRLHGARQLYPTAISDDGISTYIRWPADIDLPAVYHGDAKGSLGLVNGVMKDGTLVVQGVYPQITFVAGRKRATAIRLGQGPKR